MFDISGTGPSTPMYAEDLYGAGQNIIADQMAPGIKRMTGYESPKRKAMAIADTADLSSMKSIQDTYKKLQQINAGAASAWLKEVMPIIKEQRESKAKVGDSTTRMQDIRDIAMYELKCDINDVSCYKEATQRWLEGKRPTPTEKGSGRALIEDAKLFTENSKDILKAGADATVNLARVEQSLYLLESGDLYTGPGAGAVNFAHQIGAIFGVDSSKVSAANASQFVANSMNTIMSWISQTKGAISEKEMAAFTAASPNLSQTKEGNQLLLNTLKKVYSYAQKVANERSKWSLDDKKAFYKQNPYRHYVPSPFRWQMHLEDWKKENPLTFPTTADINRAMGISSGDTSGREVESKKGRFKVVK